jgi:hypothetical protein
MDSNYIHIQSLQLTPHDANIVSAYLFGFHCNDSNSKDYAESVSYHFLCARRKKESHDETNRKYGEYGIQEYELESYVRKKLLYKFVRKFYGKYKIKTVKKTHDADYICKNVYLHEDIFNEYNIIPLRTKVSNEYRILSQSLYEKIVSNASSIFNSKQTQKALTSIIQNNDEWKNEDISEETINIVTREAYERFIKTIDWVNMYLPDGNTNFTIKPNSKMTMLEKNKNTYMSENDNWSPKNRIEIKYGKGLRRIMEFIYNINDYSVKWLSIIKTDTFIEQYVNKLKAIYNPTISIEHIKGDEIQKWYYGGRYAEENIGTLSSSCMRGRSQQNYFDIYTMNPDKVEMIIALNNDRQLIGRAILWRLDYANGSGNNMFMDRIYGNDVIIEKFKQYAKENMYWHKYEQTYNSNKVIAPDGTVESGDFHVVLNNTDKELYPYMDTMQEASDVYTDEITLYSSGSGDANYILTSTEGKWEDYSNDSDVYIDRYDEYYHEDDVVYSHVYDENIVYDDARETYSGEYIWYDDEDYIEARDTGGLHHIDDVAYSNYDDSYYNEYVDCEVHGIIGECQSKTIEIDGVQYIVHDDVSLEELADVLGIELETNE